MSTLRVRPQGSSGRVTHITPDSAGWAYVGFDVIHLAAGERTSATTGEREVCLVLVSGTGRITAGGVDFGAVGKRLSPFEGKPEAVYVPAGSEWSITADTALTLGVCSAPGVAGSRPARRIGEEQLSQEVRGKGSNTRYVTNILPEDQPADSLLVVEVITPGGHTSSYPPHQHGRDALPVESLLEETYYHRINPPQGFAFQRVYTDERDIDETMTVEDGDVVMVPRGYHPCGTLHGYDLYYLNVMAGPKRTWKFHNDPAHEWLLQR